MNSSDQFDPNQIPAHHFWQCLEVDASTAIRADVSRQNYSMYPRKWYVDAKFRCDACGDVFCFSALEQQRWYEELGFYVDSYAKDCPGCRRHVRKLKELRQEYDARIRETLRSKDLHAKEELCRVIDRLCVEGVDLPVRMHENRRTLAKQIERLQNC